MTVSAAVPPPDALPGDAIGWLAHVGAVRHSYGLAKIDRAGRPRFVIWTKRVPERWRDERLKRSNSVIFIPE